MSTIEAMRSQFFPIEVIPGVTAYTVDATEFKIIWTVFDQVFPPVAGSFRTPEARHSAQTALRQASSSMHTERVLFYGENGEIAGWSWGVMRDYETFFMTNSGVMPAYRRQGLYTAFLTHYVAYLSASGYERITSAHQINNRAILIAKLKAGFVITGTDFDERWGGQVTMAYFPHEDRQAGFARAFACVNPQPGA